jgi:hypothetical protein
MAVLISFVYPIMYISEEEGCEGEEERKGRRGRHGHMVSGGHGLLKVSLGSAMPYPSTPYGQPPLKGPHRRFRAGRLQGERAPAILLPLWIPHDVCLRRGREGKGEKRQRKRKGGGERMGVW